MSCTTTHATCRAKQRCTLDQRLLRATAPLDRGRTTLDTYIWRSRPRAPGVCSREVMTPTAARDRTRSAEVCYTAGLNNVGCATRLRRQAKEERRGPDPSWSRLKAETTAARSVRAGTTIWRYLETARFYSNPPEALHRYGTILFKESNETVEQALERWKIRSMLH
jgi:hypothetical protein